MKTTPSSHEESGPPRPDLEDAIIALQAGDHDAFRAVRDEVERYQARHNPVVRAYGNAGRYLPVAAFREARVACFGSADEETRFLSSGTGDGRRAVHSVRSLSFYDRVVEAGFAKVLDVRAGLLLGLLPSYAPESSLVRMVSHLSARTGHAGSGFVANAADLAERITSTAGTNPAPVVLIGAAFALLDMAESNPIGLGPGVVVIETGGMKTRRKEITREALHAGLAAGFGIPRTSVWSEYGMCELFSQAWARGSQWFECPPWMSFEIVDPADPDRGLEPGRPGLLALTDLANLHSASNLLTEDLAVSDGRRFSVLGRASGAPLRGCNFLFEQ